MSDAGNNPWAMWLAEKQRADGLIEECALLAEAGGCSCSHAACAHDEAGKVIAARIRALKSKVRPTHCPTCGGVLADLRGSAFNVKQMKAAGVCALWSDNNYECARKPR